MIFRLGNITLDIDIEKTAEFHAGLQTAAESCGCVGCRNYDMACSSFPEAVREFFSMLGMNVRKATEIISWNASLSIDLTSFRLWSSKRRLLTFKYTLSVLGKSSENASSSEMSDVSVKTCVTMNLTAGNLCARAIVDNGFSQHIT